MDSDIYNCYKSISQCNIKKHLSLSFKYMQKMDANTRVSCFLIVLLSFLSEHLSAAADTISLNQSLSGNQTIVSEGGEFELGFFTPGNSHNYYIGIWYKKIPSQTVVWVANREAPVNNTSSSMLEISENGSLVLRDNSKVIWSSSSKPSSSRVNIAVLLDNGNLVLRNQSNSSVVIWQSFDHPTDTFLPEAWLGLNKITGESQILSSWRNPDDPAPGLFTNGLDPDGSNQMVVMWNNTEIYWQTGVWNGHFFGSTPEMSANKALLSFSFIDNSEEKHYKNAKLNNDKPIRTVLDSSGQLKMWLWQDNSWLRIWSEPDHVCDVYSVCGAFGICHQDNAIPLCSCPPGFEPASTREWNLKDQSSGCRRKTRLQCGDNSSVSSDVDGFLAMSIAKFPPKSESLKVSSADECKLACQINCSCTAYAYDNGCKIWVGDIRNFQQISDGNADAGALYLRLAASELLQIGASNLSLSRSKMKVTTMIVAGAVTIILSVVIGLTWISWSRLYIRRKPVNSLLIPFTYRELQHVTKNFSEKLGGGGFGSVFKGVLPDSTIVAVKRLEGLRQGEKQFRTEVTALGTIHHVNLVRLCGFCCTGTKRLLVYDYMSNGSLNHHLFQSDRNPLDWKTRYRIILGVARGLAYLHEKCRECIIHCDVKPENILLDADFCPKVADFGMAKLIDREFSRVLTTMRGTIGYLAPEWIAGLPITPKVDVYGFGMMVLELISGRRNTEQTKNTSIGFFPVWAANAVISGDVLKLLDEKLEGNVDIEELDRVCRVACWCIQDNEAQRPSMGLVVQIMEGVVEVNMPPMPATLKELAESEDPSILFYEPQYT